MKRRNHAKEILTTLPDLDDATTAAWNGNTIVLTRFVADSHTHLHSVKEAVAEVEAIACSCAAVEPDPSIIRRVAGGWEVEVTFLREAPRVVSWMPNGWWRKPRAAS